MTKKSELGKIGEELAYKFLIRKGYRILDRNYRQPWGELDIICHSPDKILTFVEVKTVRGANTIISPESQVTRAKFERLKRTSEMYANQSNKLTDKGWRIDLIAINIVGDKARIKHYKNIAG